MTRPGLTLTLVCLAGLTAAPAAQRGPAPAAARIPADVIALACAPKATYDMPDRPLRVTGGQDAVERRSYMPGDLVTINAGTDNGIEVGQEYFIRRLQVDNLQGVTASTPANIQTVGWLRIWAVDDEMSLATISHACDTIDVGDYLEPLVLPVVSTPETTLAKAQRSNYGKILFGTDRRTTFGARDFFTIDRGSDHGVRVGARFVVYHDKQISGNFLFEIGEAVAVDVSPEVSTLQVTLARSVMTAGDYVAIRK
jgi:hypothetical protein